MLSGIGSSIMIILIIADKNLRSFSFYLLFNVGICNFLTAVSSLLIVNTTGY